MNRMILFNLSVLFVLKLLGCGEAQTSGAENHSKLPLAERVYCGSLELPVDFEALEEERIFCVTTEEELEFFVQNHGHLESYRQLLIKSLNMRNLKPLTRASLQHVQYLEITDNPELLTLEGLGSLQKANTVIVTNNANLQNLKGLDSLQAINNGFIEISYNSKLTSVDLPALKTALDSQELTLYIGKNPSLRTIDGFNELVRCSKVGILENPNLERIKGFSKLVDVERTLAISNNPKLIELDAFHEDIKVPEKCVIRENSMFSTCVAMAFCEQAKSSNDTLVYVKGNAPETCN